MIENTNKFENKNIGIIENYKVYPGKSQADITRRPIVRYT